VTALAGPSGDPDRPLDAAAAPAGWILDRITDGALVIGADLGLRDADARWAALTGQDHDDALGPGWLGMVDAAGREDFAVALADAFARGEGVHGRLRLRARDERTRWIEFIGAPPVADDEHGTPVMVARFRDVTDEAEADRRAEELTRVLEASTDLVAILDAGGRRVHWANDAMAHFLGTDPVGTDFTIAVEARWRDRFIAASRAAAAHHATWQGELLLQGGDGSLVPVSALFVAHRGDDGGVESISLVARDITPLRDAEARVQATESRLAALVEHASDIVVVIRRDGRVTYASPAFLRVLGHAPGDLDDRDIIELVHPDDADSARSSARSVVHEPGAAAAFVVRVRHAEGTWRHLEIVATNLLDNHAVAGIVLNARDVTDRVEAAALLRERAYHDDLTGLPNRALMLQRLRDSLRSARDKRLLVGVLFLDLDRFKVVNDSLGHAAGDELLREVARRIGEQVRPGDTVARLGGDEFVVIINDMARRSDAAHAARRLRRAIAEPIQLGHDTAVVTASVGIAVAEGEESPDDLLRDSDTALYRAKERGRDRAHVFDDHLREHVVRRLSVEQQLRRSLDAGHIELHYQPVVRLPDRRVVGAEALVRLRDDNGDLMMPGHFIAVAEDAGLIGRLGADVLARALVEAAAWTRRGDEIVSVGVNVSARQLTDSNFPHLVAEHLERSGLSPTHLYLELTESSLVDANPLTERSLRQISAMGVGLALDDFGTGFSSLAYLKRFPIDLVKIDRTFTDGLGVEDNDTAIVKATIALSHSLGIRVVAEGVETPEQLEMLTELGCDLVQGYHTGRPMPSVDFDARLVEQP
jgi:diguanylate cyclase (GGDEF)-like protein/PAS domain S-box-containing protein